MMPPVKRFSDGLSAGERSYPPTFDRIEMRRTVQILDHLAWLFAHYPEAKATISADGEPLAIVYGDEAQPNDRGVGPPTAAVDMAWMLERLAECCLELIEDFRTIPPDAVEQWISGLGGSELGKGLEFTSAADLLGKIELMAKGARAEAAVLRGRKGVEKNGNR